MITEGALLSIRDLEVSYVGSAGPVPAVRKVSLSIGRGEIVGLLGESGSGKSTLAQSILRVLGPPGYIHGGSVEFMGQDLLSLSEAELEAVRWRRIGMVFQSSMNALNPVMTIRAQLSDVIERHCPSMSREDTKAKIISQLELVDLKPEHVDYYPHMLSGGMRQRVVIGMAMALEPELLIMDEPTTALDVIVQRDILQRILDLQSARGFSVLFITHDLPLIFDFADRVAIMRHGELLEEGTVDVIRSLPQHTYTRELLEAQSLVR